MHHAQLTDYVRQLIRTNFSELGESLDLSPHETILIRQGYYCGRRFTVNEHEAIWFIEENQIKFYDMNGRVVQTTEVQTTEVQTTEVQTTDVQTTQTKRQFSAA